MNTILIIDDNTDYRLTLAEVLELEAHKALMAANGQIGMEMIRQHLPSVIVCDVDMPVINGIEVLKAVKSDPLYSKIPFIMLTGHRDDHTLKVSRALGAEAYLTKPVAITEFLSVVDRFLGERPTDFLFSE